MKKRRLAPPNPWDLSAGQCRALDAMCEHGCHKVAADALSMSPKTLATHLARVRLVMAEKAGQLNRPLPTFGACLVWDRWRRGDIAGAGLPPKPIVVIDGQQWVPVVKGQEVRA